MRNSIYAIAALAFMAFAQGAFAQTVCHDGYSMGANGMCYPTTAPGSTPIAPTQLQAQGQAQGQLQGQQQGQVATGGTAVSGASSRAASNVRTSVATSATVNAGNQGTSLAQGNTTSYSESYKDTRQTATAYASPLTSSQGTCLGSASGGAQAPIAGISFGTTRTDKSCLMITQANALRAMGLTQAACERMMQGKEGKENRDAMKAAGMTCANLVTATAEPSYETADDVDAKIATAKGEINQKVDRMFTRTLEK